MTTINMLLQQLIFAGLLTPNAPRKKRATENSSETKEPVVEKEQPEEICKTPEQELDDFSIEMKKTS